MSKFPIIIVEGPDGVGKTTLARHLVQELGAHYLHLTYRWGSKMFDYHSAALFFALKKAETMPVVIDRWWPSEVIYADAYRGGSKWPLAHRMFEKAALAHGISYVFCLPTHREKYLQFYNELKGRRAEMYDDGMERVYDGYLRLITDFVPSRHGVYLYDFMEQGNRLDTVCQDIIEMTEDIRQAYPGAKPINGFMNVTGCSEHARYVFVGDELKPKTRREVWPFFEYGNSSLFLAETFEKLNLPESHLMFINIQHPQQQKTINVLKYLSLLGRLTFVAMGKTAEQCLTKLGIEHRSIKHPQYYRRFSRGTMVKDIMEAIR